MNLRPVLILLLKVTLYDMLKDINRQQGVTIVVISHDLELVAKVAKSALCIDHGICFRGDVHAALRHHHKHGYFFIDEELINVRNVRNGIYAACLASWSDYGGNMSL